MHTQHSYNSYTGQYYYSHSSNSFHFRDMINCLPFFHSTILFHNLLTDACEKFDQHKYSLHFAITKSFCILFPYINIY